MQKRQFLNLNEGDYIYVYSGGNLEAQGRYISVVEDKNESFLCWRKHNGNKVYTNLNDISVETMNENITYLQNSSDTYARDYNNNYYNQDANSQYHPSYNDAYNQGSDSQYHQGGYNYNLDLNLNSPYNPSLNNHHNRNVYKNCGCK
ncbi:hypothetical protein [Bacillus toyonensis]|uniref:hypothetical protein n=1 Tax=Bacillus toyonensis TaxID=155322 RepID=UPI0020D2675F|nr:hypothetical protein [Bacillus toyonensis]